MSVINCSTGELIRELDEQEEQAYKAIQQWARRLNEWEYAKQTKRNKGKKIKTFTPNDFSLILIEASKEMINKKRTPEETMSLLHSVAGRTEARLCREAGY